MKRARMEAERRTKRTRSSMKMMVPMVVKPRNVWGVTASKRAMPPVLMVRVNHLRRVRWGMHRKGSCYPVNARPGEMMETLSQRYGTGMVGLFLCHFEDFFLSFRRKLFEVIP